MQTKWIAVVAVVCSLLVAGAAQANLIPGFQYVICYDGMLEQATDQPTGTRLVHADTLIVVNNSDPSCPMAAWLEVFDKYGELIWEGEFFDGGQPIPQINGSGYGWITLGMVVPRDTHTPYGYPGGEKFHIRISAKHIDCPRHLVPTVEIKQVIYFGGMDHPADAIWQPSYGYRTWTETSLGGNKYATGVVYAP